MDTASIIAALERDRLNQAIAALQRRPGTTVSGKPDSPETPFVSSGTKTDWPGYEEALGGA